MDPNDGRSKIYSILFMSSRFAIRTNYVLGQAFTTSSNPPVHDTVNWLNANGFNICEAIWLVILLQFTHLEPFDKST